VEAHADVAAPGAVALEPTPAAASEPEDAARDVGVASSPPAL